MKTRTHISIPYEAIAEFCKRHNIRKMSLFGSVLRDDFRPDSDVDVLVEFEPGKTPGFEFFTLDEELAEILGRGVDLQTLGSLHPRIRRRVEPHAEVVYEAD